MTVASSLVAFTLAAALLAVTPGVDTAMVLRTATVEGAKRAAFAAAGICAGCLLWGAAVALGVGALIVASTIAFDVLRFAGAAYLAYLGVRLLLRPRASFEPAPSTETPSTSALSWGARGLLTNLLNPKVGVFYVTLLPQFVPAGVDVASFTFLLAAIHVALSLVWFAALIAAAVPLGRALRRPRVVRALDRVTGLVFLAFGAKLALGAR
jgi:threonine/homoserine/homoserine lactone efflux protein